MALLGFLNLLIYLETLNIQKELFSILKLLLLQMIQKLILLSIQLQEIIRHRNHPLYRTLTLPDPVQVYQVL